MKLLILNIFLAMLVVTLESKKLKLPIDEKTMKQIKKHFNKKKYRKEITMEQLSNMKNEIIELKDMIKNYRKESIQKQNQQNNKTKSSVKKRENHKKIKRRKKLHKKKTHKKHKKTQRKNFQISNEDFENRFQKVISKSLELPAQQRALFQQIYDEVGEDKIKNLYKQIYLMQPQNRRTNLVDIPMNIVYMGIKLLQPFTFLFFLFSLWRYFQKKKKTLAMQSFLNYQMSNLASVLQMKSSMKSELSDSTVKLKSMVQILGTLAYTQSDQIKVYKDALSQ